MELNKGELLNIPFPNTNNSQFNSIKSRLCSITKGLRDAYYKVAPKRKEVYPTPFGGPIGDSIGPWPEFILRGLPCQKSKMGCCTPCFYSRLPQVSAPPEQIYDSLIDQVSYILRNFDALVIRNQSGPVAWPHEISPDNPEPVALVLTPTGSFFDEYEFPLHIRNKILSMLVEFSKRTNRPIALHVETHAEHFQSASEVKKDFDKTISLLAQLNGRILFGFESSNPFVRNVLYNKFLDESAFLNAINIASFHPESLTR